MNFSKKIKNIVLLGRCLVRAFFYGRADKIPKNISRIIVMPDGKLGDVVCATPVLSAIRKNFPQAYIIVGGNSSLHRALLSDSGLADDYLDFGDNGNTIERIKKCRADVALVTGPTFEVTALLFLAGIPLVIAPRVIGGYSPLETRSYNILKRLIKTFLYQMGKYAPRERLRVLEPLGIICDDTTKHLGFSEIADKKATDKILKILTPYKYLVGISAGAGNKEKRWDPKKFAEVANHLIKNHNAHIIVFGGKNDAIESAEMMLNIKDKSMMTNSTVISIDDLKATISKLDVFISVNTGPIYIAEAMGIPTVDIIGPVNPWDQPPQGRIHKIVFPPGKPKPLLVILDTRSHDIKEAKRIAQSTRLEDVISATEEAIQEVDKLKK